MDSSSRVRLFRLGEFYKSRLRSSLGELRTAPMGELDENFLKLELAEALAWCWYGVVYDHFPADETAALVSSLLSDLALPDLSQQEHELGHPAEAWLRAERPVVEFSCREIDVYFRSYLGLNHRLARGYPIRFFCAAIKYWRDEDWKQIWKEGLSGDALASAAESDGYRRSNTRARMIRGFLEFQEVAAELRATDDAADDALRKTAEFQSLRRQTHFTQMWRLHTTDSGIEKRFRNAADDATKSIAGELAPVLRNGVWNDIKDSWINRVWRTSAAAGA